MSSGISRRRIAAEVGVSIATVSRVMTGNGRVAPGTREHVRAAADRLAGAASDRAAAPDGAVLVRCPYALTGYFGAVGALRVAWGSVVARLFRHALLTATLDWTTVWGLKGNTASAQPLTTTLERRAVVTPSW
ncbi:helix-turn-helix domain-containing protein [Streptomyces sp. IBSBF 2435]|uniref:helix-turn-helix domain-containing protein n=1 Tax=Streptomyces sp. IBSBF 2435 TaxID=2903531 RepID=UPI002FDC4450